MSPKLLSLGGIAIVGGAGLLAGAQTWVSFMLDGTHDIEPVTGHALNPALSPVAIAIVAAALALTIAGPVFRRVLGVLVALLGAGLVALTLNVVQAPLAAVSGRITEITGIAGGASTTMVVWSQVSAWVWVSLAAGLLAALLGVLVVLTGGRWATGGRKYDSGAATKSRGGAPDRISDWDALSDGDDPTAEIR